MSYDWSRTPIPSIPQTGLDRIQTLDDAVASGGLDVVDATDTLAALVAMRDLRGWYARVGNRDVTTGMKLLCVGDSHTAGEGATTLGRRWIERVATRLAGQLGLTSTGIFYPTDSSGLATPTYPVINVNGNRRYDLGFATRCVQFDGGAGGSSTFTFTSPGGVGLGVRYLGVAGVSGVMRIVIDGGAPITVDTGGGSGYAEFQLYTTSPLSSGAHTAVVTNTSPDKPIFLEGFEPNPTAQLRVYDSGWYGSISSGWTGDDRGYQAVGQLAPDVATLALGSNDQVYNDGSYSIPPSANTANLTTIISKLRARVPNLPVLLLAMPARDVSGYASGFAPWSAYLAGMKSIAATDPLTEFLDLGMLLGPVQGDVWSLFSDNTHMSDRGHGMVADVVTAALTRSPLRA